MKPVDQLHTVAMKDGMSGDCWRACIATILCQPCDAVPHFIQLHKEAEDRGEDTRENNWWTQSREYVQCHSLGSLDLYWQDLEEAELQPIPSLRYRSVTGEYGLQPGALYAVARYGILTGQSPRGDWSHAVVVDLTTAKVSHDPHPSRAGVLNHQDIVVMAALIEGPDGVPDA